MQLQKSLLIVLLTTAPTILAKKGGGKSSSSSSDDSDSSSSSSSSSSDTTTSACASCECYLTTVLSLDSYPDIPFPLFGGCEDTCPFDKSGTPITTDGDDSANITSFSSSSSLFGREPMPAGDYVYLDCLDGQKNLWATTLKDESKRKQVNTAASSGPGVAMSAAGQVTVGLSGVAVAVMAMVGSAVF